MIPFVHTILLFSSTALPYFLIACHILFLSPSIVISYPNPLHPHSAPFSLLSHMLGRVENNVDKGHEQRKDRNGRGGG